MVLHAYYIHACKITLAGETLLLSDKQQHSYICIKHIERHNENYWQ